MSVNLQMSDFQIAPLHLKIFDHQPPMALIGRWFTTEQAAAVKEFAREFLLDATLCQQSDEFAFVDLPVLLGLFVIIKDLLGWGEIGTMHIVELTDFLKEIAQIVAFGESGQL